MLIGTKTRLASCLLVAAGLALGASVAKAGQATFDFTVDPTTDPAGKLTIAGNNDTPWQATGGNPGGFLAITYPIGSQSTFVVFPDIDSGKIVDSFVFECDLRVGNSTGDRAADGFSISFARANDPFLADPTSDSTLAGNCCAETGTKTGIAISFDTWSGNTFPNDPVDKSDIEGIIIRVDDVTVKKVPLPTRHGTCTDATSLQTGPRNADYWTAEGDPKDPASWADLCWAHFYCSVDKTGKVTVKYKNTTLLDNFQTAYFPSAGRLVMAGRTGGANEHTHVDNIKLNTTSFTDNSPPSVPANVKAVAANARRVTVSWDAATDDSGRAAYEIERDGTLLPVLVSATSYSFTAKPETTYSVKVRSVDPALNKSAFSGAVSVKTPVEVLTEVKGFAKIEVFSNISGTAIDALTGADSFTADSPDIVLFGQAFEGLTNAADNYGARVSGFITPKDSGDYVFFISADDNAQFFLSTDDKPANKKMIAQEPQWNDPHQWVTLDRRDPDLPENRSDKFASTEWPTGNKITLTAGKKYYAELLYKEGGGGDNGSVFMKKASEADPAAGAAALSGDVISAMIDVNAGKPSIATQLKDAAVKKGTSVTFSTTEAFGSKPQTVQWFYNGKPIAGATSLSYTVASASLLNTGVYRVEITNGEGSASSSAKLTLSDILSSAGILFIEAEDFDFGGGKTITDKPIGMTGKYPGGDFADKGTDADVDIDYHNAGGNAGQPYRPGTGVAAGKPNAHADGLPRGTFDVTVNHVVGWNDDGDWQNYTRTFPAAADYNIVGRLASGGAAIHSEIDEVTAGVGTTTQTLKKLGEFNPGRATAGWDNMELFPLVDANGDAVVIKGWGGKKTIRWATIAGANQDIDYIMFIPVEKGAALPDDVTAPGDSIVSSSAVADSPAGEQVANAIDNKASTKYLNFKKLNTGMTITPAAGASVITGLGLTSANDAPERDPASYKLEGSNDGTTFTLISEGAAPKFTARAERQTVSFANTAAYTVFRLTFPTVVNAATANSMQIAEVELLGVVTGAPAGPKITKIAKNADGTVTMEWTGGGTLQAAGAVTGPWADVTGAKSPYTFKPDQAATFGRIRQ
jgi:hypothetical protein